MSRLAVGLLVLLCSSMTFALSPPQPTEAEEKRQHRMLEDFVLSWFSRGDVIGSAVVVVRKGKIAFAKAYGVTKKGEKNPVDLDTIFQLGSVSKPLTTTLFAVSPVREALPLGEVVKDPRIPFLPKTRVRDILTHTTGYSKQGWNAKIESGWSRQRMLDALRVLPQKTPGLTFAYSNFIFSLIEDQIATAMKMPFKEVFQKYVINQLGLKRTSIDFAEFSQQPNRAFPHLVIDDKRIEPLKEYSHRYHETVLSAAGVNSSANDVAKILMLHMGCFPEIASKQVLDALHEPAVVAPDALPWFEKVIKPPYESYYAYGWRVLEKDGERIVFHGGYVGGFINFVAFSPKDEVGIIVLNNSETSFAMNASLTFLSEVIRTRQQALAIRSH